MKTMALGEGLSELNVQRNRKIRTHVPSKKTSERMGFRSLGTSFAS